MVRVETKIGFALGTLLIVLLPACTRSVDLLQTPVKLPGITSTVAHVDSQPVVQPTNTEAGPNRTLAVEKVGSEDGETPEPVFAVLFLAEGEVLNVRAGSGVTEAVVGTLQANVRNLKPTGQRSLVEGITWIELESPDGTVGWVSGQYLTEQTEPGQVCDDPRVGVLLDQFTRAVKNTDGRELSRLISPSHGLTIHHNLWNPAVVYEDPQVVSELFTSTVDYDWGIYDGSGDAIVGPFKDILLPRLEDVLLQNHTRHCNTLERGVATGPTAGYVFWPFDYANLDYVALYRSAPADQELDWRTWAVGIEYVDGKPYLAVLIQFHWEI